MEIATQEINSGNSMKDSRLIKMEDNSGSQMLNPTILFQMTMGTTLSMEEPFNFLSNFMIIVQLFA
jgi:hypothetical protein